MLELIEKYVKIAGISGDEGGIRAAVLADIKPYADEITVDALGNIIVFKKGKKRSAHRLMIDAHMDEIGLIIKDADKDGYLSFETVGGIDERVIFGKRVRIGNVCGVIGGCAVHLLKSDDKNKVVSCENMKIDIGAESREQALSMVSIGDGVVFDEDFHIIGGKIAARALDDRVGCAALVKMIQSEQEYDAYYTFSVQEEVGCRGAAVCAYTVKPEFAIAAEATTAADICGAPSDKQVCVLGDGAVVSFMDNGTMYDKPMFNAALECGKSENINVQVKRAVAGGNNSSAIHKSRGGVRTLAVSLPCRYIHSQSCVADIRDVESYLALIKAMMTKICSGEIE